MPAVAKAAFSAPPPFRMSFLVGGLLAEEASIAAPTYLELHDWKAVRVALRKDNLLHARTQASAVRTSRELVQRMETLADDEVRHIATAPSPDRKYLMWAAFCRRYQFVSEFAEEVLRDKHVLGENTLRREDFDRFWASKALWHGELDALKPSSRMRLRYNLFLAMRQASLLTEDGLVVTPILSPQVTQFLEKRRPSDFRFFPIEGER